jgi:ATP-dependent RNA helicase RhlE
MEEFFPNPERIEAAPSGSPLSNIDQTIYNVPNFNTKVNLLEKLLQENKDMTKVLVFVSTKRMADDLHERLQESLQAKTGIIHSNKDQNFRFNAVKQFQDGGFTVLIATDIIARGIDVAGVSHVINFDTPDVPENYIHRIGRTGRADARGTSLTFVTEREMPSLEAIEDLMQYNIPVLPLPDDLEISDVLTQDELPKVQVKEIVIKQPKVERGAAFHEKSLKNQKVNVKISHKDKMRLKYGKPKTRGAKKK